MRAIVVLAALACGACTCRTEARVGDAAPPPLPALPAEEPPPEPPPLGEAREITFDAEDGVRIVADLRQGASAEAPLVVLVHQLGSTRAEWEPLLRWLGPAMTTLAIDMRGFGESTQRADGTTVDAASFQTADWARVASDVRAAIAHVRASENLAPSSIAVVGSSIGSSAAILAAADDPEIDAVVALSPGRAYRGVDILAPLSRLGERPILAIASRGEAPSAETASEIARIAQHGEVELAFGDRHGVAMFAADRASLHHVIGFLREHVER
jgi:pimeloyl-ACP methyl ester carboxylesterase